MAKRMMICTLMCLALVWVAGTARAQDFQIGWELRDDALTKSVDMADVDGDGDLDIWFGISDAADQLLLNDGAGVFTDSGQTLDSGRTFYVEFADVDGDLDPDAIVGRLLSTMAVWVNDGDGNFVDSGQYLGTNAARRGGAVADIDDDGDLDIIEATDTSTAPNRIWLNDGNGIFTDSGQNLGEVFTRAAAVGDVDDDDDIDILFANNGRNTLYLNDGNGAFTDSGHVFSVTGTFDVALIDIDDDGDLDIFEANGRLDGEPNLVWFNDGNGVFTDSGQELGNEYSFSIAMEDYDGDSDLDAFIGNNGGIMDRVWLNDGSGNFTDSGQALGVSAAIYVAKGDVNGDLKTDVVVANSQQPNEIWLNDGFAAFSRSPQVIGSGQASSLDMADVDGDQDIDAVVGHVGAITRVLLNLGDGTFADSGQALGNGFGNNNGPLKVAMLNNDSYWDLFITNSPSAGNSVPANRVWFGDAAGQFTDSGQRMGMENTGALALGDVDGDDDIDAFIGNAPYFANAGANELWLNDGDGVFSKDGQALGDGNTRAALLVDVNDDTYLDLVVGNTGLGSSNPDPANKVWINNGAGMFTDSGQALGDADTYALAAADLDGDDDLDLFAGNNGASRVWLNNGAGTFTDSGQLLGNSQTQKVTLLDAEGDGDLDAWLSNGNSGSQVNRLWVNDGSGGFSDAGLPLASGSSKGSFAADLDADDDDDVFVVNGLGAHRTWLNFSAGGANQPPSFIAGGDQNVDEDSGAQEVPGWASAIDDGDEAVVQALSFLVSTSNDGLFSVLPTVSADTGTLSFTPAPDAFGTATVSVRLIDDGGGDDTSAPQVFDVFVQSVNDAPGFLPGPVSVEASGDQAQTVVGWATQLSPGPSNESGQSLSFIVTTSSPEKFAVAPVIAVPSGSLSFTPAPGASGSAGVEVILMDDGGQANGGQDTSDPIVFSIVFSDEIFGSSFGG